MRKFSGLAVLAVFSLVALAGGNPEFVPFPDGYKESFRHYSTQNRQNGKQVADMYANEIAANSAKKGELTDGSVIVMEVYKTEADENGDPIPGPDGIFKKSKLAAVAVMEKRSKWDEAYPADERAGNWGFALYNPAGKPKENDLACASCHKPLADQDFMFTFPKLSGM